MLSEISQSDKDKCHMVSLICGNNDQSELTSKMKTDSESRLTALGVGLEGGGIKQKGARTHRYGQQCGDCWGVGGIRGLNGNGKKYNKIRSKRK